MIFGTRAEWAIEVEAIAGGPPDADAGAAASWCRLSLWARGLNLTAHIRAEGHEVQVGLHWPAIYLARWLVSGWAGLWEREGSPVPGAVVDGSVACQALNQRIVESETASEAVFEALLDKRDAFVASHALQSAAAGGLMPAVYLLKEGDTFHVTWRNQAEPGHDRFLEQSGTARVSAVTFLEVAEGFIGWVAELVAEADPAFGTAANAWRARLATPEAAEAVLRGYAWPWGAPDAPPIDLESSLEAPPGWRAAGARFEPSRLAAAIVFRSLTPSLETDDVARVYQRLARVPSNPGGSAQLDSARAAVIHRYSPHAPPHIQGQELAEALRTYLVQPVEPLDVEALLMTWGVAVDEMDLSDPLVDGAAVWGNGHGPLVVTNAAGRRTERWARRMTLAHELCHLLVDVNAAVPLAVVSSPWTSPLLERRANAFAAELLLPERGLRLHLAQAIQVGWATAADRADVMSTFDVGETVCSHQIKNRLRLPFD